MPINRQGRQFRLSRREGFCGAWFCLNVLYPSDLTLLFHRREDAYRELALLGNSVFLASSVRGFECRACQVGRDVRGRTSITHSNEDFSSILFALIHLGLSELFEPRENLVGRNHIDYAHVEFLEFLLSDLSCREFIIRPCVVGAYETEKPKTKWPHDTASYPP